MTAAVQAHSTSATGRTTAWWGMVLLIATEATLFAMLILSYLYLRYSATPVWPPDGIERPTLALPAVMTLVLVSSSVTMHLASRSSRDGRSAARGWLLCTLLLGLAFLTLQGVEYHAKAVEFTPRTNAYGSLFFTITGFHGLHVLAGAVMIAWAVLAVPARASSRRQRVVENVALYWHFVDAVWIVVVSVLYLAVRG